MCVCVFADSFSAEEVRAFKHMTDAFLQLVLPVAALRVQEELQVRQHPLDTIPYESHDMIRGYELR